MRSKLIFHFLSVSFLLLFLYACGSHSNGVFEKRKHLKGWHFHKKGNISQHSSEEESKSRYIKVVNDMETASAFEDSKEKINEVATLKREAGFEKSISEEEFRIETSNWKISSRNQIENNKIASSSSKEENKKPTNYSEIETHSEIEGSPSKSWGYSSVFLLSFLIPFMIKAGRSRQLQHWAADNKTKSRSLLVVLKTALVATSFGLGYVLETPFTTSHLAMSVIGIGMSYGLWEYWKSQNVLNSTRKIGLMGAVNSSTSFGFFALGGMFSHSLELSSWSMTSGLLNQDPMVVENSSSGSTFLTVLYIVLATLLLIVLLYLILILSCRLACSGAEVFAVLILVLASYLVISLFLYVLLKLTARKERENSWFFKRAFLFGIIGAALFSLISLAFFEF